MRRAGQLEGNPEESQYRSCHPWPRPDEQRMSQIAHAERKENTSSKAICVVKSVWTSKRLAGHQVLPRRPALARIARAAASARKTNARTRKGPRKTVGVQRKS